MPLLAYNKTGAPLPLAAGNPIVALLAASSVGALGESHNVTLALRPDPAVDPVNGVPPGVSAAGFALIQAQVAAGQIQLQWTTFPEYRTASLSVGSALLSARLDSVNIYVDVTLGSDDNPGTLTEPLATLARAMAVGTQWRRPYYLRLASGTYPVAGRYTLPSGPFGPGDAAPMGWIGGFTSELGARVSTVGTTANDVIDSTLTSIRTSAVASIDAVAGAGQSQTMTVTGLVGLTAADVGKQFRFGLAVSAGNNGTFQMAHFISANSATFFNAQAVVEPTGLIYWQDCFEGSSIALDAKITCVAVASLVNNDFFTVINNDSGATMIYEYKVSGAFVPVAGRTTIDVSADSTAAGVAQRTATLLSWVAPVPVLAQLPSGLTMTVVANIVYVRAAGVVTITKNVANPGFAVATTQSRQVRDLGVEATGAINVVPVALLVDNDNFFLPDGNGSGVTFEYKVTAGFVPAGGRVTIDVSALVTAGDVAAATRTAISAVAPTTLRVRATNTLGSAQVQVKNMLPGSSGNVAITEAVANAGFTVSGFSGGVGTPTTTFSVDDPFSPAPTVGDIFLVQKPAVTFQFSGGFNIVGLASAFLGMQGIKLQSTTLASTAATSFLGVGVYFDRCETDLLGRIITMNQGAVYNTANTFGNDPTSPFGANLNRVFTHNGTLAIQNSRMLGRHILRSMLISNPLNGYSEFNMGFLDGKRTSFVFNKKSAFSISASAAYSARLDGTLLSTDTAIVKLDSGSSSNNMTQLRIINSSNHGVEMINASDCMIGSVTGNGNARCGIHVDDRSGGTIDIAATTATVTGELGDIEFGRETTPNRQSYSTVRTPDVNGVKGYPPSGDTAHTPYRYRLDVA